MRLKPRIDAMGMKPMITSRKNRSFVSISKLWETDDALDAVFEALSVEVYDGNWSKNGWIDTGQLFDGYSYMLIIAAFIVMIIVTNIVTFNIIQLTTKLKIPIEITAKARTIPRLINSSMFNPLKTIKSLNIIENKWKETLYDRFFFF